MIVLGIIATLSPKLLYVSSANNLSANSNEPLENCGLAVI